MTETLDMIEPRAPGVDPVTGAPVPGKPGGFIISAPDLGKMKTALEIACQLLGKRCTREIVDEVKKTGSKTFTKGEVERLRKEMEKIK